MKPEIFKYKPIIDELEDLISRTEWYEFLWRARLRRSLEVVKYLDCILGMELMIQDLKDIGIIKLKDKHATHKKRASAKTPKDSGQDDQKRS